MITLTLGCGDYDRTRPLADGRVSVPGVSLAPVFLPPQELFPRAVGQAPFDVTELSASSHIVQVARGAQKYVALPIFLARSFRFDAIYVRANSGIETPADLQGRRVGLPEYQLTMAVWLRGILQDRFSVDFHTLRYVTGGVHAPGRKERVALSLPASVSCTPAPTGQSLNDLLRAGEIDALMSPYPPEAFLAGDGAVRRLFNAPAEAERAFFSDTGIFPIMHFVGLRRDLAEAHPHLPGLLMNAFETARRLALEELRAIQRLPALPLMLPWLSEAIDETFGRMGADPWPYGVERNRRELETLCRYAREQHLTDRFVGVEELFREGAPSAA